MREQNGRSQERESLVKGLKDKLEWYTMYASDEEYDEKAVESILYLLDSLEPLEEQEPEEAWEQFQTLVRVREESNLAGTAEAPGELETWDAAEVLVKLAPAEMTEALEVSGEMVRPELEDISEAARKIRSSEKGKSRKMPKVMGISENGKEAEASEELGISARLVMGQIPVQTAAASTSRVLHGLAENQRGAVRYNKYIVAAVLLLLVVSVVGIIGNVQAGASPDTGFFYWLKRDNTGIQMITSPENLDNDTDVQGVHTYSNSEDVPEWAQEWLKVDDEFEMPENYEWDCYEVEELRNFHKITSYYMDQDSKKEMLLGMIMYHGEISFNTEELVEYKYVDSYEIEKKEVNIFSKTDEMGINYYLIYFFEGNCQYFMQGQDNLEELKALIEQYWFYVKNNLEENEIICNKLLSQAIYK